MESLAADRPWVADSDRGGGILGALINDTGCDAIFLLPAVGDDDRRGRPGDHAEECGALGAGAYHGLAGPSRHLPDALRTFRCWRADHSLCRRDHGVVPIRDHADFDRAAAEGAAIQ